MKFFDSHAHCDDERIKSEYDGSTEQFIRDSLANGVGNIMNIGTNIENSKVSVNLAKQFDEVFCAVGIHPSDSMLYDDADTAISEIEKLLSEEKVVAIGEIGFDYHYDDTDKEKQRIFFEKQMILAEKYGLPVIIHDRDAHGDTMEMIKKFPKVTGVLHSFSGSAEMVKELVKLGWYVSFSGPITYKNAQKPKEACAVVPLDRILIETDSPYLPPVPHRGEMNRPSFVKFTAEAVASIHSVSIEEIAKITKENAKRIFGI